MQQYQFLTGSIQVLAVFCFAIASIGLIFSLFRFLKASAIIFCWLLVAAVSGFVAFPQVAKLDISTEVIAEKFHEQKETVTAYLRGVPSLRK